MNSLLILNFLPYPEGVSRSDIENQGVFKDRRLRCLRNASVPSSQSSRKDDYDFLYHVAGPTPEGYGRKFRNRSKKQSDPSLSTS